MGLAGLLRSSRHEHEQMCLTALLTAVLAVPLIVALVVLHDPRWYPSLEIAQTEMHVRAGGSRHPRLVGLVA